MGPIWGDMGVFVLQRENIKPLMHTHTRSARRNRHHALFPHVGILQESDPGGCALVQVWPGLAPPLEDPPGGSHRPPVPLLRRYSGSGGRTLPGLAGHRSDSGSGGGHIRTDTQSAFRVNSSSQHTLLCFYVLSGTSLSHSLSSSSGVFAIANCPLGSLLDKRIHKQCILGCQALPPLLTAPSAEKSESTLVTRQCLTCSSCICRVE